jgi:hypothetical protein
MEDVKGVAQVHPPFLLLRVNILSFIPLRQMRRKKEGNCHRKSMKALAQYSLLSPVFEVRLKGLLLLTDS